MRLTLRTTFVAAFVAMLVLLLAVGLVGIFEAGRINSRNAALYDDDLVGTGQVATLSQDLAQVRSGSQNLAAAGAEIMAAVRQAAGSAAQITASVRQHAVGMEQTAAAMGDINGAPSQSLVAVGDTRQAAENLNDLAGSLTGLVAQYAR